MRRSARASAVLLVAGVVATFVAGAPGIGAQVTDPDASDRSDENGLEVILVDQTIWLDPDGEIVVSFGLSGEIPDDATVEITLHERIASRSDFAATLERRTLRGRLTDPPVEADIPSDGEVTTARIPIRSGPPDPDDDVPRLGIADPGVHPLDIAVYDDERTRVASLVTHVVRPPLDAPDDRLGVVPVLALDAPPAHRPDGTASVDAGSKTGWAAAVETLGDHDLPLVVSARPETLVALDASDAALDQRLVDDLDRLLTDRTTLATSGYVAVQPDALLRAGLADDLGRNLDRGAKVLSDRFDLDPAPDLWIETSGLSTAGLEALSERGVDRLVVDGSLLDLDGDDPAPAPNRATRIATSAGNVDALVADPFLGSHLGSSGDPVQDVNRLLADLAVTWFASGDDPGSVALLLPSLDVVEPSTIDALVEGVESSPLLTMRSFDDAWDELHAIDLDADPPVIHQLLADTDPSDLGSLRRDLDLTRLGIASFGSVFTDTEGLADEFEDRLAVIISSDLDESSRAAYHREIGREIDLLFGGLDLPERRAITLPARDGTIPLTVTNTTDRTMQVAVLLDSEKLTFLDGDRITVTIDPGTHTVEVEVSARASGVFPLEVLIESPDGNIELATARYTIRSAAVSGVGIALSAAAVVVLAVWWIRTSRRARAAQRADDGALIDDDAGAGDPAETGAGPVER